MMDDSRPAAEKSFTYTGEPIEEYPDLKNLEHQTSNFEPSHHLDSG
jgi:hypothetical protein